VSLSAVWQRAEDVSDYGRLAGELIGDPVARARWGDAARESVAESHDEGLWVATVEDVYRRAAAVGPVEAAELEEPCEELTPYDTIVHRIHACTGKQIPLADASTEAGRLELASRSRAARLAFGMLGEQRLRYPLALAAPPADADVVSALVDEFRRLAGAGLVERFTMVVQPALVDEVVPLIEAALAAGPDVDIDLVAIDDLFDANEPGTLLITAEGDAFGPMPADGYPHQHPAA
jgi:hypothetical protein